MHNEWEPTIKVKIKNYVCSALCDLGASVSTIPKSLCDVIGFTDIEECSLNLHLADSTIKKPMWRITYVLILANRNYVPIDFIVLDIDYNPSSPIILGRPFLRTIDAVIDMKKAILNFNFHEGTEWNYSLERELGRYMNQAWGHLMDLEPNMTTLTSYALCLARGVKR